MDAFPLIFLVLMIVVFYFFLIRPQSKRRKEQQQLIAGLSVGDEVITAGGIVGEISSVTDDWVSLKVAENVKIPFQKGSVHATLPRGTLKDLPRK